MGNRACGMCCCAAAQMENGARSTNARPAIEGVRHATLLTWVVTPDRVVKDPMAARAERADGLPNWSQPRLGGQSTTGDGNARRRAFQTQKSATRPGVEIASFRPIPPAVSLFRERSIRVGRWPGVPSDGKIARLISKSLVNNPLGVNKPVPFDTRTEPSQYLVSGLAALQRLTPKPTEGSFHYPTSRQELKAFHIMVSFDDLQQPTAGIFHPFDQLPSIGAVGPN